MKKTFLLLVVTVVSGFALTLGQVPPEVTIEGKEGGLVGGGAWHSSDLKGKVHVLFYVDPDERDANEPFSEALQKRHFPDDKYRSVAIVNMAASWLPNIAINAKLELKRKKYPRAVYVRDKKKVLVRKWALADDSSDILVLDKEGKLIYQHSGALSDDEIQKLLQLIENSLEK